MNVFDQEIMARTALGEARGEGENGMIAVMWTGLNRFTAKKWFSGQSIAGTFLKPLQYDCWMMKDSNYGLITNIGYDIGLFKDAMAWAEQVLNGAIADPTLGATHYYATSMDAPSWADTGDKTVQLGRHVFYKNVD